MFMWSWCAQSDVRMMHLHSACSNMHSGRNFQRKNLRLFLLFLLIFQPSAEIHILKTWLKMLNTSAPSKIVFPSLFRRDGLSEDINAALIFLYLGVKMLNQQNKKTLLFLLCLKLSNCCICCWREKQEELVNTKHKASEQITFIKRQVKWCRVTLKQP